MRIALTAWLAIVCLTTQSTCAQTADGTVPNGTAGSARDETVPDRTRDDGTTRDGTARDETTPDETTETVRDGTVRDGTARDETTPCRGARSAPSSNDRSSLQKPEELPIKYIGNCISFKFHRPSCPFGKAMAGSKAVFFHFRKQAIEDGYQPCRYCLPPFWKSVHSKILKSSD